MKQHFNIDTIVCKCMFFAQRLRIKPFLKRHSLMLVFLLLLSPTFSFSQINVLNNGLAISNNTINVIINGNLLHLGNGSITNSGNFYVTGNLINNNSSNTIFTTGSNGWVHVIGDTQTIGGNTMTHFNNLELAGTGMKQLSGVNAEIEDSLTLNDREFYSGDNTVYVMATGTGAISYLTNGFVSSTHDGGLSRNTLSTNAYVFPVGSNLGTIRYRPVDIAPNSASASTFKVRMANVDATTEGFDRNLKLSTVGEINPNFYHRINRTSGTSPADITLYFDNSLDGDYNIQAQWQSVSLWKGLGLAATSTNYGFSGLTTAGVNDFSTTPFALSTERVSSIFVANVFSPNGDGNNDIFRVRGKGVTELQFIIFDRWGEKVFESNDVNASWDGTFKGKPMDTGVFVYFLKGKFNSGETFDKKGNVTLLR